MAQPKEYRHSLQNEIAVVFAVLTLSIVFLHVALSYLFLDDYYTSQKRFTLESMYHLLADVDIDSLSSNDKVLSEIFDISLNHNIAVLVMNNKSTPVLVTINDRGRLKEKLEYYLLAKNSKKMKILRRSDKYVVQLNQEEEQEYLEMWGILPKGDLFLLQAPVASIRDSVSISNNFLLYISLIGIGLGMCIILFVSRKITKPIMDLAIQSKRMAELSFDVKYEGKHKNEIGLLGDSMNQMSYSLERTIAKLKTANMELTKDLESKAEAEERRSEFLSNVSHELKTPIALIQGYAEGLKESINDTQEEREFYCDVIIDEAFKMNKLVKSLLSLNELESGSHKIIMERFDIIELIRNLIKSNYLNVKQKGVDLKFVNEKPIYVWSDEFKIEEVLTNYISNAFHHVNENGTIEIKVIEKPNQKVCISVFNTGRQIPQEDLDKVWQKFYKVDKARTRAYGGSGIGLSIVSAIMESLHQGYGVHNYKNGVEFWFELETRSGLEEKEDEHFN